MDPSAHIASMTRPRSPSTRAIGDCAASGYLCVSCPVPGRQATAARLSPAAALPALPVTSREVANRELISAWSSPQTSRIEDLHPRRRTRPAAPDSTGAGGLNRRGRASDVGTRDYDSSRAAEVSLVPRRERSGARLLRPELIHGIQVSLINPSLGYLAVTDMAFQDRVLR